MKINQDKCMRCGACANDCTQEAIIKCNDGNYTISILRCINCGACLDTCPEGAIEE